MKSLKDCAGPLVKLLVTKGVNMKLNIKTIQAKVKRYKKMKPDKNGYKKSAYNMHWQSRNEIFKDRNVSFNPKTFEAYSYDWWCFVKQIKGQIVFNDYGYSMTTNKHQGTVRRLLQELGVNMDKVIFVNCSGGLQKFKDECLHDYYEALLRLQLFGSRKKLYKVYNSKTYTTTKHKYTAEMLKRDIKQAYATIKKLRKLGAIFPKSQIDKMRTEMLADDTEKRREAKVKRQEYKKQKDALMPAINDLTAINFFNKELNSTDNVNFLNNNN